MSAPTLVLGDFDLTDWAGVRFNTSVIAEGTSRGGPVSIDVAVQSWLQDGSVVLTQGYDNRTVTLRVRLRGPDLVDLADCEAALVAELGKPNLLTWTPADSLAPASVFEVVTSQMVEAPGSDGDLAEQVQFPWRTYNLSLTCKAFVRSADEVVSAALATTGTTTTLVNNGSATTNWTGAFQGVSSTPAVVSGAVGITSAASADTLEARLTYTASIDTSTTKYLVVDWRGGTGATLRAYGDGVELRRDAQFGAPTAGYVRSYFYVPAASIGVLRLESTTAARNGSAVRSLFVDNINRTDIKASLGSARQLIRSIDVVGSVATQGRVSVEHESSALGDVLAYFWTGGCDGYSPPLRQYRSTGGSVTTDTGMVSGAREDIKAGSVTFDVPASNLAPGPHLLVARLLNPEGTAQSATLSWTAATRINGAQVGASDAGSCTLTLPGSAEHGYVIVSAGRVALPTVDVDPSSPAVVRLVLSASSAAASITLDEAWLFNTQLGQLVQVECGAGSPASGGSANRVFIEPPTVTIPRPTVRVGFAADRSDSFYPGVVRSWQQPRFAPPRVNVLTVTTNALDASATFTYFPQWHTHAAM